MSKAAPPGTRHTASDVERSGQVEDEGGKELWMYLRYGIGMPVRTIGESKVRGGPDPDFSRIYRTDRGIDVVRSLRMQSIASKSSISATRSPNSRRYLTEASR